MPPFSKHHRVRCWGSTLTGFIQDLCFSKDGSLLAVSDSRGILVIFDLLRGRPMHLVQMPPLRQATALIWSSNDRLVVGDSEGGVILIDVSVRHVRAIECQTECAHVPNTLFSLLVLSSAGFRNACWQLLLALPGSRRPHQLPLPTVVMWRSTASAVSHVRVPNNITLWADFYPQVLG